MDKLNRNYIDAGFAMLPPQMIPMAEKTEDWGRENMDILEGLGRRQHYKNVKLIENYEMVKGRFIFRHYFNDENYLDMVNQLTREFELPNYLRHYDITSQIINTMSGEWSKRPDAFRVKSFGEQYDNDYLRAKTDMLLNYIQSNINNEINQKLVAQGLDPNKSDFKSPQEQQQYLQLVDQQKQALTPPEIEIYMSTKWMQIAEIWGQHQLEYDREHFKLNEKEKREFEDMLIADRCFRHFYLVGESYKQETWNPINTFFHKSPEVEYIEEGDYVGRVHYLTMNDIIDRFGWLMDQATLEQIRGDASFAKYKGKDAYGIQYGSVIPFQGYQDNKVFTDAMGFDPMTSMGIPTIGKEFFTSLHTDNYTLNTAGLFLVTEAYWKSQRKIGKVIFFDEDGILTKQLVDENFIVPPSFKQVDSSLYDSNEPNTVVWTWVNEIWKGIKINASTSRTFTDDIYLDIKPLEFQFKGDLNPYNAKLPVCGSVFSVRNSQSMSLVDLVKPHQIGYNIAMNQLYQIMEREVGRFVVMDVNMFPQLKDWGGEKGWEKFMTVAKGLGMAPIDTSPNNIPNLAASGGQYPKDVNMDESARMASRMKIAEFFETLALKQVGFNEYRLGNFAGTSTAAGVEQGTQQSYAQTETYFTNFSNYLRRCYTMNLDIAQYVQSKKQDITISYIKSDLSRAFIKMAGMDLLGNDMGVFVSNSQEQIRQLEMLRQLAMTNNTSGATPVDLANIITMNSPQEIKLQLAQSFKTAQAREDRKLDLQQQQMTQQADQFQLTQKLADLRQDKDDDTKIRVAEIMATKGQQGESTPTDTVNPLDQQKANDSRDAVANKIALDREKQITETENAIHQRQIDIDKLALEQKKIDANITIEQDKIQVAKILKGQSIKDSKKKK